MGHGYKPGSNHVRKTQRAKFKIVLWQLQGEACFLCRKPLELGDATFDHLVPKSRGGGFTRENIRLAHKTCNAAKANKNVSEYLEGNAMGRHNGRTFTKLIVRRYTRRCCRCVRRMLNGEVYWVERLIHGDKHWVWRYCIGCKNSRQMELGAVAHVCKEQSTV